MKMSCCRGQFFDKHLKFIVLNSQPVSFNDKDMSYLMKVSNNLFSGYEVHINFDLQELLVGYCWSL